MDGCINVRIFLADIAFYVTFEAYCSSIQKHRDNQSILVRFYLRCMTGPYTTLVDLQFSDI